MKSIAVNSDSKNLAIQNSTSQVGCKLEGIQLKVRSTSNQQSTNTEILSTN